MTRLPTLLCAVFLVAAVAPAAAVDDPEAGTEAGAEAPVAEVEAPYDRQLMRLSEILGSVHYLRRLCGEEDDIWRRQMETLLATETPSEERRAKLVASFNHGYRSFSAIYTRCTESAVQAIDRYMKEGEALTSEIVLRYGN